MSDPETDVRAGEGLQLDRAEYGEGGEAEQEFACAACGTPLHSYYFQLNAAMTCEACRYKLEQEHQTRPGFAGFLTALAAGVGAAAVGSGIYYAVLALSGYEVGLVSILVGFMVGHAVRWGARGKGGWAYQTLAVSLTYLAIVTTYIPLMFREMANQEPPPAAAQAVVPASAGKPEQPPAPVRTATTTADAAEAAEAAAPSAGEFLFAVVAIVGLAAALPFLAGFENIIGLLIIGFGLWEAWKLNKRARLEISGPFAVGARTQPAATPQS